MSCEFGKSEYHTKRHRTSQVFSRLSERRIEPRSGRSSLSIDRMPGSPRLCDHSGRGLPDTCILGAPDPSGGRVTTYTYLAVDGGGTEGGVEMPHPQKLPEAMEGSSRTRPTATTRRSTLAVVLPVVGNRGVSDAHLFEPILGSDDRRGEPVRGRSAMLCYA